MDPLQWSIIETIDLKKLGGLPVMPLIISIKYLKTQERVLSGVYFENFMKINLSDIQLNCPRIAWQEILKCQLSQPLEI